MTTITVRMPDGSSRLTRSPLTSLLLKCIEAAYDGLDVVIAGDPVEGVNDSLSDFLTFIFAYPAGVATPKITVHGSPEPVDSGGGTLLADCDVVLASGGVDSSAALLSALELGRTPTALWCDYGQPYAAPERAAVRAICDTLGVDLVQIKVGLEDRVSGDDRFGHVIPGRNLLIAAIAAALGASAVTLAGLADELIVPDKSLRMYSEAEWYLGIPVKSPFVQMTKTDVLRVWDQRWRGRLDASATISCYRSTGDCQDCSACAKRAVAFIASGYDVRAFPVFRRQQELIRSSWIPRLPNLPRARRADLLIALGRIAADIPSVLASAYRDVEPRFRAEVESRRRAIAERSDIG